MSTLEEVKKMKAQGAKEENIIHALRDQGVPYRDIAEALAQTQIKAAVESVDPEPLAPSPNNAPDSYQETPRQEPISLNTGEQPMPSQEAPVPSQEYYAPTPTQYGQQQQQYTQNQYDQYQQQPQYSASAASPDLVTEISEQVVAEKLGDIRKHLEKVIDMKTTVDSRIELLDERLKKIEKTIDVLQSSVLRKVGDYVTNVQDIKNELVETQKTFAKLLPGARKTHEPSHKHAHK